MTMILFLLSALIVYSTATVLATDRWDELPNSISVDTTLLGKRDDEQVLGCFMSVLTKANHISSLICHMQKIAQTKPVRVSLPI